MSRNIYFPLSCIAVSAMLLIPASQAYAKEDRSNHPKHKPVYQEYHKKYQYPVGTVRLALTNPFSSLFIANSKYYVSDGIFYIKGRRGYTVVAPPIGAIVREAPSFLRLVKINGITYYTNDDYYYQYTPQGYLVVPAPVPVTHQPLANDQDPQDTFTINIPNSNGTYTAVNIIRSGSGFVGPQGEFFTVFPSVEQLKVMYGK